jgi:hypothetical protein
LVPGIGVIETGNSVVSCNTTHHQAGKVLFSNVATISSLLTPRATALLGSISTVNCLGLHHIISKFDIHGTLVSVCLIADSAIHLSVDWSILGSSELNQIRSISPNSAVSGATLVCTPSGNVADWILSNTC